MFRPDPDYRALVGDRSSHMVGLATLMLHSLRIRDVDDALDRAGLEQALMGRTYDLVLVDADLAGEGGFALIRALRQAEGHPNRAVPIIMMAASPSIATIAAARDAGVTEFLRKPFSAHHIELRLESMSAAPRNFVAVDNYAGPDRRRRVVAAAPTRRAIDDNETQSA